VPHIFLRSHLGEAKVFAVVGLEVHRD